MLVACVNREYYRVIPSHLPLPPPSPNLFVRPSPSSTMTKFSMESLTRLLLEFSGLLERDYCRARRDEHGHGHGQNGIHGDGGVGGSGGGGGTAGRRIENMGVLLEQLAPLLDWESEVGRKASVDGRTALRFFLLMWLLACLVGFAGTGQS